MASSLSGVGTVPVSGISQTITKPGVPPVGGVSGSGDTGSGGTGSGGTGTNPSNGQPTAPTPPTLNQLKQSTPAASTFDATSAGTAPSAAAVNSGYISAAQAQTANPGTAPTASTTNAAQLGPNGQMNPNDSTNSASQLNSITAANSPYIQLAEQQGLISAAGRGLENSSFASGAAEAEAVRAAAPFAQQNAGEAAQSNLQNAALQTQASEQASQQQTAANLQNAQLGTQASEFNTGENVQQSLQNAAEQTQTAQLNAQMQGQTAQFNAAQTQSAAQANKAAQNAMTQETMQLNSSINQQYLSGTQAEDLASIQGQYNQLIQQNASASQMYGAYFSSISTILSNQNIDPARAANALLGEQNMLSSGLGIIDAINGGTNPGLTTAIGGLQGSLGQPGGYNPVPTPPGRSQGPPP